MSRDFQIFGSFMVEVSGGWIDPRTSLGLTVDPVRVVPRYNHKDIYTNDFGPDVPVETLWNMAEAYVFMNLVHYDSEVLEKCMRAAMGGGGNPDPSDGESIDGFMAQAGRPMGFGRALGSAACQYTTLYLTPYSGASILPYRFYACYLNSQPLEIPLGSERTVVRLNWRVIPYQQLTSAEVKSEGGVRLWDRSGETY